MKLSESKPRLRRRHPPFNISLMIFGPFRSLFEPPQSRIDPYARKGQVVADLGCHGGYYSLILAESVGPDGKVYAIDLDKKAIQTLEKKAEKAGYHHIETHAASAADLSFIPDRSVDFILANGLL